MKKIIYKKFTKSELNSFRKISKDQNPIHFDKKLYKYSSFKNPVVYAALMLKYLYKMLESDKKFVSQIDSIFIKPVFVDENLKIKFFKNKNIITIEISNGLVLKAKIRFLLDLKSSFIKKNEVDELVSKISKSVGNYKKKINLISFINITRVINETNRNKFIIKNKRLIQFYYSTKSFTTTTNFMSFDKKIFEKDSKKIPEYKINKSKIKKKILIIGGTSGLGLILFNFLKKKNMHVTRTFNIKKINKNYLVKDNRAFQLNDKSSKQTLKRTKDYDLIYFFATPKIFNQGKEIFDYKNFQRFNKIYIELFMKIVSFLLLSKKKHKIFVPSTILIDNEVENLEYSQSKKISESLFKIINKNSDNVKIYFPRLGAYNTKNTKYFLDASDNYRNFLTEAVKLLND